jgi:hypothetical protein
MTKYLRFKGEEPSVSVIERYVVQFKESIEWVDTVKEASKDYLPSIEETQRKVEQQLGIKTTLVEVPDDSDKQHQSYWAISKED